MNKVGISKPKAGGVVYDTAKERTKIMKKAKMLTQMKMN